MGKKPTNEELKQRIKELKAKALESRQAEEVLLKSIFRAAPTGIGLVSNRVLLEVNDRICQMTGYSSDELIGKNARILYPTDEDFEYVGREKYAQIRERRTGAVETRWKRKDGKIIDIYLSSTAIDSADLLKGVNFTALDITDRKQTEKALQESERFLQDVFDAIKNGISVLDLNLKIVRVNSWIEEMYSKEGKFAGRKCYEVYQKRDTPCPWCPSLKTIETGETRNAIVPYPSEENPIGWIELSSFPLRNIEGDMVGVIEYVKDITKQKQAEESLRVERDNLHNIFESIEDGIYIVDQQYDIQYANPVIVKDFGPYEDVKCYKYFHDRKEVCPWCKNQEVFAGKTVRWEWYSSKNQKTYDLIDTPLKNPDGSISKLEIFRDITDRKQARKALQESERRLAQAVQGNSIPTLIIDNNHMITHWNKACESLTGFSASEVVGTKKQWLAFYSEERPVMADFIVDETTEKEIAGYYEGKCNKSILAEGAYECENFYPDLGEKGKWLFFTAAALRDQQGKIVGAIETFQDITKRKSMEEQLRQSQKMEAVGTLAGGVAHDFNNMLTVIIGNAELALMNVIKNESLRKGIEEIKKTGNKAASLTRQLLAFSRKQIIKPEVIDINKGINETNNMLKRMIGEHIEILTILEPELKKVYADSGQIDQMIMNLTVNARDAMPKGGKLTIETANADLNKNYFREHGIKGVKPGHYVMLAISDTGSGMDKETREHIFEPFFTTKEVGKGTGLGLSTVYGIVKQSNGFIWVYSEPGQGSTFKVYLPKAKGDAEPEKKEQTPVVELAGSETVLIVEDDDGLRKFAQEVLLQHGYRVLDAENGEDALRVSQAHEGQIDLIITDVLMPKMGGKELAERLQPLYPQMKVIYMSGYTDNAIVHHGVLAPGVNFIEKPFTPESMARKVREVLG